MTSITLYHGTNQAAYDAILQAGAFLPSEPEMVAHQIEQRYGLPYDSVWRSRWNEFSNSFREGDTKVYFSGRYETSLQYAQLGSEVVFDALNAAYILKFEPFDEEGNYKPGEAERRQQWILDETAAHYQPVVLTVQVPWEFFAQALSYGPGTKIETYEEWMEVTDGDAGTTVSLPAPVPAAWIVDHRTAKVYVFDVQFAESKDTLKDGEIDAGSHRVSIEADSLTEAELLAQQMVAAGGREPTGIERIASGGLWWRAHVDSRPFDLEHATSTPFQDYEGSAGTQLGFSSFDSPWELWMYAYVTLNGRGDPVVAFSGQRVGEGNDGEDLVVPDMVTVDRMPWAEFEQRCIATPFPPDPGFGARWRAWSSAPRTWQQAAQQLQWGEDPVAQYVAKTWLKSARIGRSTMTPRFSSSSSCCPTCAVEHYRRLGGWPDVRAKAVRLRNAGNVQVQSHSDMMTVARVQGDHGVYEVRLYRTNPDNNRIVTWTCECPWGYWAFRRQHQYVGRTCSHALAVFYEARSQDLRSIPTDYPTQEYVQTVIPFER